MDTKLSITALNQGFIFFIDKKEGGRKVKIYF